MTEFPDVLPLAQLRQLVATGRLVSMTTFADHMRPDVRWIEPEEYGTAFEELINEGETSMVGKEAAFTQPGESYPGFINATLGLDEMVITIRAAGIVGPPGQDDAEQQVTMPGAMAQLRIPLADWDEFVAQAQRVRAGTAA